MNTMHSRAGRLVLLALGAVALAACSDDTEPTTGPRFDLTPHLAAGDVYTVTNTNDNGVGSLRWSLSYVTGGEIIRFDPALAGQTITVDSALYVNKPFTLEGLAGKGITLSGGDKVRVMFTNHAGVTTIRNVRFEHGNAGIEDAGGLKSIGDVVLENVSFTGNTGRGRSALLATDATLRNVTITGNTSTGGYEAAYLVTASLINTTIANNTGGGVSGSGPLTLRNSIIANNGAGLNCDLAYFTETYEGKNLSDDDSCGGPSVMTIGTTALAPVADNGGPSLTMALQAGSLAIDAGTSCSETTDGRGFPRDAKCDLGAFEFANHTVITLGIGANVAVSTANGWATVTGTITCTRAEAFDLAVNLVQAAKSGRSTTTVSAAGTVPVTCDTTPRPFSVALAPATGAFQAGSGTVAVSTANTPGWATPATATRTAKFVPGMR
jgi:hypothetical protein